MLFCEINAVTYAISYAKGVCTRNIKDFLQGARFSKEKSFIPLPVSLQKHASLIVRRLGDVDVCLQENKQKNLSLAVPHINGILIRPGEVFSFWKLVGKCTKRKGYLEGLTISSGAATKGTGGGMCQFTNLLHWMILHTDLSIIEHHHHNGLDLFPDFNRQIPFGSGTSIFYNYRDYRVKNNTDQTYQIFICIENGYLKGEVRAEHPMPIKVHIHEEDAYFHKEDNVFYRHNKIYRRVVDKKTGNTIQDELLLENNARVMYDETLIAPEKIKK